MSATTRSSGVMVSPTRREDRCDLATVLMERAGEDGLCGLLGDTDIEAVNAAATSQVYGPEELAAGMNLDDTVACIRQSRNFSTSPMDSNICRERG